MEILVPVLILIAVAAAVYVFAIKPGSNQSGTDGIGGGSREPRNNDTVEK